MGKSPSTCVGAKTLVLLADGRRVPIECLQKGMQLRCPDGTIATVRCLVQIAQQKVLSMCRVGSSQLMITPWHPVRCNDKWIFPNTVGVVSNEYVESLYNLVLDRGHIASMDGIEVCTLGHGFVGEVIGHEFFGTQKVIDLLQTIEGWEKGFVVIDDTFRAISGSDGRVADVVRSAPCMSTA